MVGEALTGAFLKNTALKPCQHRQVSEPTGDPVSVVIQRFKAKVNEAQ